MNKILLFFLVLFIILMSCRPREREMDCCKGIIIGVNPCVKNTNNSKNVRFLQILGEEEDKIGSNFSIEDITYHNVVQVYNIPTGTEIGDTICFTYSITIYPKVSPNCMPSILTVNMASIMVNVVNDCEMCQ